MCHKWVYVTDRRDLPASLGEPLFVDVETYGRNPLDPLDCHPRLVTLADAEGAIYVIDMFTVPWNRVKELMRGKTWVGHNVAFDIGVLEANGFEYPARCKCTMTASKLLFNGVHPPQRHDLASCMEYFCKQTIVKDQGGSDWAAPSLSADQIRYAASDVGAVRTLLPSIEERIQRHGMQIVFDLECAIIPAVVHMRKVGVSVDQRAWTERAARATENEERLRNEILSRLPLPPEEPRKTVRISRASGQPYAADLAFNARVDRRNATRCWNLGSHTQVRAAFAQIGIELPDTRYETLIERHEAHPVLDLFIAWRDVEKEAGAFGLAWLDHVRGDGRVHPDWRLLGAASGRMSCSNPNLQQIKRGPMRNAIVSSPGRLLVRADFSQIEARIAARISADEVLTNLFLERRDIHTYAAARILGKPSESVTREERQIGKSLVFGLLFGMSAKSLRIYCRTNYGVKLSPPEAEDFRSRFFEVFPGLRAWHERTKRRCGAPEVHSLLGRRRLVLDPTEKDWNFDPETGKWEPPYFNRLGVELNHPVQGTAADLLKIVVREIWERRAEIPGAEMVMLVHDEIVLETMEERAEETATWLRSVMVEAGNSILHPIPVDADIAIGKSWNG